MSMRFLTSTLCALIFSIAAPLFAHAQFITQQCCPIVIGGGAATSTLSLQSTSGVGTTDAIIFGVGNNGATEAMRIIDSGLVGIGATVPGQKLTIGTGNLEVTGTSPAFTSNASEIQIGGTRGGSDAANIVFGDGTGWKLYFARATDNAATKYMTIQDNGKVGIGTVTPLSLLTVGAGTDTPIFSTRNPSVNTPGQA